MYQLDSTKGWHSDFEPLAQPPGTYRRLVNGVRSLSAGIASEPSSEPTLNLGGLSLLGWCELSQDLVLFLGDGTSSQVGVLDSGDTYKVVLNHPDLSFDLDYRVCATGEKNFKGERVVYFTDGKNPLRFLNLDNPPTQDVADNLRLVTYATLPYPTWLPELENSGEVKTGVYQVVARQLTRSTNPTSYGLISPILPVVEENRAVGRDFYDGALPQTPSSKALQVRFDNLDPDYPFLQVVIITFQGTSNQFQAYEVGTVGLNGKTSYTFTYRGEAQHSREVLLEELVTTPVRYETAKVLTQKDGILVASNLTSKPKPTFDFQSVANRVTLRYTLTEVLVDSTSFTDYKDELVSATQRGYRRGETYAFALSPLYGDYQDLTAYHIPAPAYQGTGVQELDEIGCVDRANSSTRALGTYQSTEVYPTGFGYPTGQVRYHVMPTISQEPLLVSRGGQTYLRILGVEADFSGIPTLPPEVSRNLVGFNLLRMERTLAASRILTQGIAMQHVQARGTSSLLQLSPWAGHLPSVYKDSTTPSLQGRADLLGFFSPESVFNPGTTARSSLQRAQYIKAVTQLTGTQTQVAQERASSPLYYHVLLDYQQESGLPTAPGTYSGTINQSTTDYLEAGPDSASAVATQNSYSLLDGSGDSITTVQNNGYLLFKTTQPLSFNSRVFNSTSRQMGETAYIINTQNGNPTDLAFMDGQERNPQDTGKVGGTTQRLLYNLTLSRPSQYGKVEEGVYYRIGTYLLGANSRVKVWGGDTFLTKWSVLSCSPTLDYSGEQLSARTLHYFWCESSLNLEYRHYLRTRGVEGEADYQLGTLPYYPKYKILFSTDPQKLGLFNYSPSLGHSRGYNGQYSFTDKLLSYFPVGILEEEVTRFENRSIYSQQALEGEQLDQYRIFLPNDYQDIPKHRGPITQTFTLGNTFWIHTSQGLWRTFFNEQVTQASSVGEVYLGTGGVFTRPPVEVSPKEGGNAGCQGQWGLTTPYGHFFPDTLNRKIWRLEGEGGLEDLTKQGIRQWGQANITPVEDKPARGKGYALGWDYRLERLLVTKLTTPAVTGS